MYEDTQLNLDLGLKQNYIIQQHNKFSSTHFKHPVCFVCFGCKFQNMFYGSNRHICKGDIQ